jgi:hypothetical protein
MAHALFYALAFSCFLLCQLVISAQIFRAECKAVVLLLRSILMTGDQSRLLKVGDRVCWGVTTTDLGTVIETTWNGVTISWDDGHTTSIQHNDMAQVERVPTKIK